MHEKVGSARLPGTRAVQGFELNIVPKERSWGGVFKGLGYGSQAIFLFDIENNSGE